MENINGKLDTKESDIELIKEIIKNFGEDFIIPKKKKTKKESMKSFVEKQRDKKYQCEICKKEYKYFSKSNHLKSKYHLIVDQLLNQNKKDGKKS